MKYFNLLTQRQSEFGMNDDEVEGGGVITAELDERPGE